MVQWSVSSPPHQRKFPMGAQEHKCQTPQNDILHMKSTEFYLRFHNSCEIWPSFSRAWKKASLKPY